VRSSIPGILPPHIWAAQPTRTPVTTDPQQHQALGRHAGRPRRVLHVTHYFAPHIGGIETVAAAETRGLAARGWDVALVSGATGTTPGTRWEDGVLTVRVRAWNRLETRFGVPFPVYSPLLVFALWRQVRRADLVHIHDLLYLTSWIASLFCWVLATPYVVHRHVEEVHHSSRVVRQVQRLVFGSAGKLVLRRAAAILPIDEFIASHTRAKVATPERVEVLGNGVDTTCFRPPHLRERQQLRREFGLPIEEALVLFVGRFVPKKGFARVAAAASDRYRIVFVGDERPVGVDDDRLIFMGALPVGEMPLAYRCADVFVCASVGECPLTVLESMSSGLPVLLNEDPALHSPWTAGPGVRFVDMAAGHLAEAIHGLVDDPEAMAKMGHEACDHVQQSFSWVAHLDKLERIYRRALDGGR
jgi:D-inositol-3-phosphate glycosyltransferase